MIKNNYVFFTPAESNETVLWSTPMNSEEMEDWANKMAGMHEPEYGSAYSNLSFAVSPIFPLGLHIYNTIKYTVVGYKMEHSNIVRIFEQETCKFNGDAHSIIYAIEQAVKKTYDLHLICTIESENNVGMYSFANYNCNNVIVGSPVDLSMFDLNMNDNAWIASVSAWANQIQNKTRDGRPISNADMAQPTASAIKMARKMHTQRMIAVKAIASWYQNGEKVIVEGKRYEMIYDWNNLKFDILGENKNIINVYVYDGIKSLFVKA